MNAVGSVVSGGTEASAAVLVVDDDPTSRMLAAAALEDHVGSVEEAEDGLAGCRRLEAGRFDLAIVDLEMPVMDGFGLIERVRAVPATRHLPVIVVTGRDDTMAIERAFALGATSFVCKPLNWSIFRHQVGYVLRVARAEREARIERDRAAARAAVRERQLAALEKAIRGDGGGTAAPGAQAAMNARCDRIRSLGDIIVDDRRPTLKRVRAADLASKALRNVAAGNAEAAARIVVEIDDSLELLCASEMAAQALAEVMRNALDHSPPGSPVRLTALPSPPDRMRFEIADQGSGMAEDAVERLVAWPLPREIEATAGGSSGLGLAAAQAVAERHGGHVGILSEPDRGTEVFLSFPAVDTAETEVKRFADLRLRA